MSDIAIKVKGLSKRYRIGVEEEQHDTLFGALASWVKSPAENYRRVKRLSSFGKNEADDIIWALKDVSFEVERGEVVGVIGRNGAGKSTLLKILSHITEPTSGYAKIRGRVSSLLEVGTGFHDELTGRENVYLNGTILGMSKAEVDRKFDEIVAFSGVEKFIDTPVKRYSSGMKVRLAFAVAAHLEPEILLIDEVLAVGDVEFQKKCLGKMREVTREGRTVLFVSHDMGAIQNLCPRTILLGDGSIEIDDATEAVLGRYLTTSDEKSRLLLSKREDRSGTGRVQAEEYWWETSEGITDAVRVGTPATLVISLRNLTDAKIEGIGVDIGIDSKMGVRISHLSTATLAKTITLDPGEKREVHFEIKSIPFHPGRYRFTAMVHAHGEVEDWIQEAGSLNVEKGDFYGTGKLPPDGQGCFLVDYNIQSNSAILQ
jgi:lipopolysaccharide transport system ATP-binding protein